MGNTFRQNSSGEEGAQMGWRTETVSEQRLELVTMCSKADANISELCRRYGVSRRVAYKWMRRYREQGMEGLKERSRGRHTQPKRTAAALEGAVVAVRNAHRGVWGARKIAKVLDTEGWQGIPALSTITAILRRHERLSQEGAAPGPFKHFERSTANQLWQMDFKGHFAVGRGRCHPLTILDDHSRFSLAMRACADEREETVRSELEQVFRRYGLPDRMLMDNGSPWGSHEQLGYTRFTVWLLRLEVKVSNCAAYHPHATVAISSGRPIFPRGIRDSNCRFVSSSKTCSRIGVATLPGTSTFTRIFLPFSSLSHLHANGLRRRAAYL
jgi:transposase InsO family protein